MSFNPVDYLQLPLGDNVPDTFNVVVEIPKDSTHKYEFDHELNTFVLDRPLHTSVHYPGDYGFLPQTLSEDGDPLDVLIKIDNPTFTGCVLNVRPIGVLKMIDKGDNDHKILAVLEKNPRTVNTFDITDLSDHYKAEVDHFFRVYKQLEHKDSYTRGWEGADVAKKIIMESIERFKNEHK